MEIVSICENCKNLMLKSKEPCRFCGYKRKNHGSAFVIFIVIIMVLVLLITIFGMRNMEHPEAKKAITQMKTVALMSQIGATK